MAMLAGFLLFAHVVTAAGVEEALAAEDDACLVEGDCSISFRQLRGRRQGSVPDLDEEDKPPGTLSMQNPDPEVLVWDNKWQMEDSGQWVYNGWLNVPLVHDGNRLIEEFEVPVRVCLRVRAVLAKTQPAREGPLLVHCGGPGSGRDCARRQLEFFDLRSDGQILNDFDLWSIDQRGVNLWGRAEDPDVEDGILHPEPPPCPFTDINGEPVQPMPAIYCDEIVSGNHSSPEELHDLLIGSYGSFDDDTKEILGRLLFEGEIPVNEKTGNAYFNETFVRWYYRMVKLEVSLCWNAARYQLKAASGREYYMLKFVGTYDLAKDIDSFRRAIGAAHMSVHGFSYGTAVAGVYGTIFPDTTKRMVMDGVVNPDPNVAVRGTAFAQGLHSVWNGMAKDCDASLTAGLPSNHVCQAAPRVEAKAMSLLTDEAHKQSAAVAYRLLEKGLFQEEGTYSAVVMACIEHLHSRQYVEGCPEEVIGALEQSVAVEVKDVELKPYMEPRRARRRYQKAQPLATGPMANRFSTDRFGLGLQAAVLGTDTAGRLDEEAFVTWWRHTREVYPMGVAWAIGWVVAMATWPGDARPVPPLGSDTVAPVIVGNLHDPNTAYTSAQQARKLFPEGAIMTWQGYGHCLSATADWHEMLAMRRKAMKKKSLPKYTNRIAKYMCANEVLKYLETGDLPSDGFTCLLSAPLDLGSALASEQAELLAEDLLEG